jgi:sporulation protein YlmC with PRC-barrel domain
MKNKMMCVVVAASALCIANGSAFAEGSSTPPSVGGGGGMPAPDSVPKDKRTDLTGGQQGVPDEYANTPVRQGSLTEVKDSKWLNQSVTNKQGEKVGKVTKVLRDAKTQKIEYVVLEVANSYYARPMLWSRFEERGDKLILNATKEELMPSVNSKEGKDLSPDLAAFMSEIEKKREEPKPKVGPGDGRGTNRPAPSAGPMGEEGAAGNLGPRGGPAGEAPGYEGEGKK